MIQLLKKLLDKLETPANDWVLSRFGGSEAPVSSRRGAVAAESPLADDQGPESETMPLSSAGPFDHWFDEQQRASETSPPQSGEVMSRNASDETATLHEPERKSRVS